MVQMPTPTSQEQPPKSGPTPADAIAAIGRGEFQPSELTPLSDLGRADTTALARAWRDFPEAARATAVRCCAELAETNLQYTFGRVLRIALDDPSALVRQLAVAALWEDDGTDLVGRYLMLLRNDQSQDVRAEAAQGLATFADRAAEEGLSPERAAEIRSALVAVAGDATEPYLVRRRALESVAVFGSQDRIVDLIREAYDADDHGARAGALYAMGRSLDRRWLPTILAELESADAEMRYEAARASGRLGDDRAVPGLAALGLDLDPEVRCAAIDALGNIGGSAAVSVLRALRASSPESDAEAIEDALEEATTSLAVLRGRA